MISPIAVSDVASRCTWVSSGFDSAAVYASPARELLGGRLDGAVVLARLGAGGRRVDGGRVGLGGGAPPRAPPRRYPLRKTSRAAR